MAMITAGSVRGNCRRWQSTHSSSCPASRGSSRPPQRGQCRVANSHSASPIAWKTRGACSTPSDARYGSRPRRPVQPSPSAYDGSTTSANQTRPSRSPSSTLVPSDGASTAATQGMTPSSGRSRVPATTSTREPGPAHARSSQSASARLSPTRSWEPAASSRCGNVTASRLARAPPVADPGSREPMGPRRDHEVPPQPPELESESHHHHGAGDGDADAGRGEAPGPVGSGPPRGADQYGVPQEAGRGRIGGEDEQRVGDGPDPGPQGPAPGAPGHEGEDGQ